MLVRPAMANDEHGKKGGVLFNFWQFGKSPAIMNHIFLRFH